MKQEVRLQDLTYASEGYFTQKVREIKLSDSSEKIQVKVQE